MAAKAKSSASAPVLDEKAARGFVQPIRRARTFEAAIDQIIEGIESTRLRVGDRLPDEGELSSQLGISKATLRQALRVLESSGLIEVRRGKGGGIFLRSDFIPKAIISGAVAVEEDAFVDALRARRAFEPAIAELAMANATEEDFQEIERTNELFREALGDRELTTRAGEMFHRAVARASHNSTLLEISKTLHRRLIPVRDAMSSNDDTASRVLAAHTQQLEAMRAGNLRRLRNVLDEHHRIAEESFAEAIGRTWDELFGPRPR